MGHIALGARSGTRRDAIGNTMIDAMRSGAGCAGADPGGLDAVHRTGPRSHRWWGRRRVAAGGPRCRGCCRALVTFHRLGARWWVWIGHCARRPEPPNSDHRWPDATLVPPSQRV